MVSIDPAPGGGDGRYRFGDVELDAAAHTLVRGGRPQALEPKAFAVLLALLRRPGELIPRDALLDAVWGHRHVTPGVLTRAIAQLRHALDDDPQQPKYIVTQHALGYRFVGTLEAPAAAPEASAAEASAAAPPSHPDAGEAGAQILLPSSASADALPASAAPAMPADAAQARPTARVLAAAAVVLLSLIAAALWFAARVPPPPAEASVAVLPFTTLSDDRDDRYFAEGLAVELHDALTGVPGLKVAAWMSPGAVPRDADAKALGRRLGVATLLDASVRRDGTRLRINARLSDTATGVTLWSDRYDRELSDLFAVQSEIATHVAGALTEVLPSTRAALSKRLAPTRNIAAFDAYLRGLTQLLAGADAADGGNAAIGHFTRALAADRRFARAQAGICRSEVSRFETRRDAEAYARAQSVCAIAEDMDPGLSEVKLALAELHYARGETGRAVAYFSAAERDPARRPAVYAGLAMVYGDRGQRAKSLEYFGRAQALRPGDARIHAVSGYYSYLAGDLPAAIASYRSAIALDADNAELWNMLGMMYMNVGDNAASERALRKAIAIAPHYAALSNLGELEYQAGRYAAAAELHRRATALEPNDFAPWGNYADALRADPRTARRSRDIYREAAARAQRYVEIAPEDAKALAALAWYRVNLGQREAAKELITRSETLGLEAMEVALYNAQTLIVLGQRAEAQRRVATARAAGMPESRIATNPVLRSAGLASAPADRAIAPRSRNGQTRGD